MKQKEFTYGEILRYVGTGFIGFKESNRQVKFIEYTKSGDALVQYDNFDLVVTKYELQRPKKKENA